MALILLPSCVVTRSRYGNGLSIEMPEVFKKGDKTNKETKQKPAKRQIRFSSVQSQDTVLLTNNDSTEILKKDSSIISTTSAIASTVEIQTTKTSTHKIKKQAKHPIHSNSKTLSHSTTSTAAEVKNYKQNQTTHDGGDIIEMVFDLIVAFIVGMAIIGAIVYILILILPADVIAMMFIVICILGWLIDLLS